MRTHLRTPSTWISLLALVFAMSGGAVAAGLITSEQIKDGSIRVKDFKKSERGKLRGKRGPAGPAGPAGPGGQSGTDGATGARGPSAFEALPSGETLLGGGALITTVSSGAFESDYAPIPAELPLPLSELTAGRNIFFPPGTANAAPGSTSASCTGTASAPTAPAGTLCVYPTFQDNVMTNQLELYAGAGIGADRADTHGFQVTAVSSAAGTLQVTYVWAYTAP